MIKHILVALDLTDASKPALRAALDLARPLGARVTALYVTQPPHEHERWCSPFSSGQDTAFLERTEERERADAQEQLDAEVAVVARTGEPPIATVLRSGVPSHEIVDLARDLHVDLIVTGTHGRQGFTHALLGSVAERVLRSAHCAVLTVHSPA